eukprot:6211098-Pleurochrysis_carterae.AAC.2
MGACARKRMDFEKQRRGLSRDSRPRCATNHRVQIDVERGRDSHESGLLKNARAKSVSGMGLRQRERWMRLGDKSRRCARELLTSCCELRVRRARLSVQLQRWNTDI